MSNPDGVVPDATAIHAAIHAAIDVVKAEIMRIHAPLSTDDDSAELDASDIVGALRARPAVLAALAARTPLPAKPDDVYDGVEWWEVRDGLDVTRDATGQGAPSFRVGDREVSPVALHRLRDALAAALADGV